MFKRIAHVCLNVKSLERSIDYYSKLGFEPRFKFTRNGKYFGVYMELNSGNFIEIFENPEMDTVINNGIAHFCLETDDIDMVIKKLIERDVQFTQKKLGCDNTYQVWLTDPDGNQFEVHQYTAQSAQIIPRDIESDW